MKARDKYRAGADVNILLRPDSARYFESMGINWPVES